MEIIKELHKNRKRENERSSLLLFEAYSVATLILKKTAS